MELESVAKSIRVVVADDHPIVREGIAAIIARERDMLVVAEATDGKGAVEAVIRTAPDVTLMDLRMPGMDGLEAIRTIVASMPSNRILVLTTFDGDEDVHHALRAGATGYLLKNAYRDEVVRAIRSVAGGERVVPARVAVRLAEHVSLSELTERERAILRLIVHGRSNREIGRALSISEATVKGHLKKMFQKLKVSDRTQAATAALRRGFAHIDEIDVRLSQK